LQMYFEVSGATRGYGYFDLQNGLATDVGKTAGSGISDTPTSAIAVGVNGFYKCSIAFTTVGSATGTATINTSDVGTYGAPLVNDTPSYAGDGSSGIYIWRPKLTV